MTSILDAAKAWIMWDPNPVTKEEVEQLIQTNDLGTLDKYFGKRIAFGTAGLRSAMMAGPAGMNDLIIIQTTQGVCTYLMEEFGIEKVKRSGVVIGYDHRAYGPLNSKQFALLAAAVFVSKDIPVYLFDDIVMTPLVPFCIDLKQCVGGIMITASHNPKQDSGYKLYWNNGCQIIPPHDERITERILSNLEPWERYGVDNLRTHPLISDPTKEVTKAYFEQIAAKLCRYPAENASSKLKIAYTPMHGVGHVWAQQAFKAFQLVPYVAVPEQIQPDPTFPTVAFPNPEEGKGALELAIKTANAHNCSVILANDPDADRLAVAEKLENGQWYIFTGNEIGALLGHWEWEQYKKTHSDIDNKSVYAIASTVSSKMLRAIAKKEGFCFEETLTGFKWMGNKANERRHEGKTVLFCFEEAIGFSVGDVVKDKDGVSAAAVFAEMAVQEYAKNQTIYQRMQHLYSTYGHFITQNHYVKCTDPDIIDRIFSRLRNNGQYWKNCGPYKIVNIRDMTTGYDSSQPDQQTLLPVSPSVHMITYSFENGCIATIRTSGTEPKIKYYVEICGTPGKSREATKAELATFVDCLVEEMLQPAQNNLQ